MAQKGNRWIGEEPTTDELKTWFGGMKLHDGLNHDDYFGGITVVSAVEKVPVLNANNALVRQERPVFTPYPRVETRVKYFTDLLLLYQEAWIGVSQPVVVRERPEGGERVPSSKGLNDGFYYTGVRTEKGIAVFIVYTHRVAIYRRDDVDAAKNLTAATPLLEGVGTKQVPVLRYPDRADENAMMKAQTGGIGRALGMIGMLVLPGAGVATAEDMEEHAGIESRGAASATQPETPGEAEPPDEGARRAEATAAIKALQEDFPAKWEEIQAWSKERNFNRLSDLTGPALKGFVRKVTKALADARKAQEARSEAGSGEDVDLGASEAEGAAEDG